MNGKMADAEELVQKWLPEEGISVFLSIIIGSEMVQGMGFYLRTVMRVWSTVHSSSFFSI